MVDNTNQEPAKVAKPAEPAKPIKPGKQAKAAGRNEQTKLKKLKRTRRSTQRRPGLSGRAKRSFPSVTVALIRAEGTPPIFDVDNMLRVWSYKANLWRSTLESDIPALAAHVKSAWENRNSAKTYMQLLKEH